jgi:AcrR family transcriptional regulator
MSEKPRPSGRRRNPRGDRGDATREKLLSAAVDVFGRYGFDGATTRKLADAAGVNLQAIPYYFGGKEGLYIATAEYIGAAISSHIAGLRDRARATLAERGGRIAPDEARALLSEIVETMAALFVSRESESWARFLIREQMEPTEAFARVYGGVMKPMLDVVGKLVAILTGGDPESQHIRLRTLSLLGGVMVFRMANAAARAQLDWKTIGPREVDAVRRHARDLVAAIGPKERDR